MTTRYIFACGCQFGDDKHEWCELHDAATDMLEALKVAHDAINSLEQGAMGTAHVSYTGEPYPIRDEVLHNIAKAIAKAEGGAK
jgi:hypothetical protein